MLLAWCVCYLHQVAIGVPAGSNFGDETLDTIRAAKLTTNPPRNQFGLSIPGVTVTWVPLASLACLELACTTVLCLMGALACFSV